MKTFLEVEEEVLEVEEEVLQMEEEEVLEALQSMFPVYLKRV